MRKHTSFLIACLSLLCISLFTSKEVKASHAAGGEIIYEWVSDSTYRIFFKFYRDCGGISEPTSQDICYYSSCSSQTFTVTCNKWPGQIPPGVPNGSPVTLGCSGSSTECSNPPNNQIPGVQEFWYYAIVTLPWQCNFWTFSTGIGSRNGSNNIAGSGFFFIETTFNNAYAQGNSSPYFDVKPIPYTCENLAYSFNNQAVDPNGDSLVTEVIQPLDATSQSICGPSSPVALVSQTPPITFPGNPFQTNNQFTVNGATGQMNFTATQQGPQTLAVRIKEYRNGVLIGSIIRDCQVIVLNPNLCNYTPSTINPNVNVDSAVWNGNQMQACQDQQMKFCFDIATTDPDGVLIVSDNSVTSASLQGMTVTYTGLRTKTVRGCVTWKPSSTQTGLRNLIITVKDSTCHPPGIVFQQGFTVPIFVNPTTKAFRDSSICPGETVSLTVTGGSNFEWVQVSGNNADTPSCRNCTQTLVKPYANARYAVESKNTQFCKHNKDTVDITMLAVPQYQDQHDTTICPGSSVFFNLNVVTPPGTTDTITWTPSTYLNNSRIPNPIAVPQDDIVYYIKIKNSANRCAAYDTARITVLDGFLLQTPDTSICLGDSIQVRVVGDAGYTYTWKQGNAGNVLISNPNSMTPYIKPGQTGKLIFNLIASRAGCDDSTASFAADVQPVPTVVVMDDQTICYGDTMRINSTITPPYDKYSYSWSPSSALDNAKSANPLFSAFDDSKLILSVKTPAGCNSKDSVSIDVLPADFIFLSNDTAICPGGTARITGVGAGLDSAWWDENSPYMSDRFSLNPEVHPIVSHTYTIYGIDTNQCRDTQYVKVTVKPAATLVLPDTVKIYPGMGYRMNPAGNALQYRWFPPVGLSRADVSDPMAQPKVNTRYFVTATTEAGCSTTDSVDVIVESDSYLDIPNVFAPGRGANGLFKVIHLGDAKLVNFSVYNRWGVKMFETKDISQGWDGRYNGEAQPMGVYIYTVEAESASGKKFTRQGNVTLIR